MDEFNSLFEHESLLYQAISHYGKDLQLEVAIEEMSELIKEIVKHKRGAENRLHIIEEIVDVSIMLDQLLIIFEIDGYEFDSMARKKFNRLRKRLEAERNEKQ